MPIDTEQERKDNFTGVLIIEINPQIFFENALGRGVASDSTVVFDIYEEVNKNKSVIFSSFNKEILNQQYKPEISEILEIEIYGHKILLDFKTIPDFGDEFQKYLPLISLGVGLVVSIVLFAFIISVITSRQRALELADQMTKSQRRILESSQDIIAVFRFRR